MGGEVDVSLREIYERLPMVETKVDKIEKNNEEVVAAFAAAHGAFEVLPALGPCHFSLRRPDPTPHHTHPKLVMGPNVALYSKLLMGRLLAELTSEM